MKACCALVALLLSCSSTPGALSLSGSAMFEGTTVDCPRTLTVQLTNTGNASVTLTAMKASGDAVRALPTLDQPSPVFTIEGLPSSLAPGASVELPVHFTPNESGTSFSATVVIHGGAQPVSLALAGQRLVAERSWPERLDFGAIAPGATATLPFELTPANSRAALSNEVIVGSGFSRVDGGLVFRPTTEGRFEGTVRLDARAEPGCSVRQVTVPLIGDASSATLTTDAVVDFGLVPPALSKTFDLPLVNAAFTQATVSSFTTSLGAFIVEPPDGGSLVVPGGTRDARTKALLPGSAALRLRFAPTEPGPKTSTLAFATDVPWQPALRVTLRGSGGGPDIEVSPTSLDFDASPTPTDLSLTVRNVGTRASVPDPLANLRLGVDGGGQPLFELQNLSGEMNVTVRLATPYDPAVGLDTFGELRFVIVATPGASVHELRLFSNDFDEPVVTIVITVR